MSTTEVACTGATETWILSCSGNYKSWGDLPTNTGDYIYSSLNFDHDGDWDGRDTTLLCKHAPSISGTTVTITKTGDCP